MMPLGTSNQTSESSAENMWQLHYRWLERANRDTRPGIPPEVKILKVAVVLRGGL